MARRLMKALEDLSLQYDSTVRNSEKTIVQFTYGDDGLNPEFMEDNDRPIVFERMKLNICMKFPGDKNEKALSSKDIMEEVEKWLGPEGKFQELKPKWVRLQEAEEKKIDGDVKQEYAIFKEVRDHFLGLTKKLDSFEQEVAKVTEAHDKLMEFVKATEEYEALASQVQYKVDSATGELRAVIKDVKAAYGDGDTSDLVLDCGGTVGFTESFVYLGSLLHCDLSDHHDVEARIKKASQAFGAFRSKIYGSADIPERLKGKVYAGGVLAVLLYGCESWCLTAESVRRLGNWHNKRIREMCRVTMCQIFVHRITSESLQKRTGVFSLEHYLASRTLLWAGHVARMPKNRLPKRLMLSWIREPVSPAAKR